MDELIKKIKKARFVFICGNGGSATTAEHFSNDLFSKGIRTICLNSNIATMTMIANDFSYELVFMKQLQVLASPQDLLITISCSGTSPNILNALDYAKFIKMDTFYFETFKLSTQKKRPPIADYTKNYGKLEDKHVAFAHEVADKL